LKVSLRRTAGARPGTCRGAPLVGAPWNGWTGPTLVGAAPSRRSFAQSHDVALVPRRFQFPIHACKKLYDKRSAVERLFASVKYNSGWSPSRAKVPGITAVGFSLALAYAVHNLRLRFPEARRTQAETRWPGKVSLARPTSR
jgi:hypothetical protein